MTRAAGATRPNYHVHLGGHAYAARRPDASPEAQDEQRRIFGSASAYSAAFYNDANILDRPLLSPADYAPLEAAARRVLARHDALDLVDVLGLEQVA